MQISRLGSALAAVRECRICGASIASGDQWSYALGREAFNLRLFGTVGPYEASVSLLFGTRLLFC